MLELISSSVVFKVGLVVVFLVLECLRSSFGKGLHACVDSKLFVAAAYEFHHLTLFQSFITFHAELGGMKFYEPKEGVALDFEFEIYLPLL